jgi:hypothetical protein
LEVQIGNKSLLIKHNQISALSGQSIFCDDKFENQASFDGEVHPQGIPKPVKDGYAC